MRQDMIVILDLGSEENPRLAREIRALGVYSEIHPHDITLEELKALPNVKGIILNGGANRIVNGVEIDAAKEIYNYEVPVLLADHKGDAPWPDDGEMRREALSNFVFGLCGAQPNWNMENFIADQVELIRRQVGERKVLLALSGGVDSSVVAALLIKAIGKQLTCVHVNHGLLRKGEPEQVVRVFRDEMDANLIYVDAVDRFLDKLAGVADPRSLSGSLRKRHASSRASSFWPRGPFIPTSSSQVPRRSRRSNPTTTWGGCPRTLALRWWSR